MIQDSKQNQKKKASNFLEILKNSSAQRNGVRAPEERLAREQYLRGLFAEKVKRTEKELYNGKNRQLQKETQVLLEQTVQELKELKKANASLGKEVEKAVFNPPDKPSPYFFSFLLHVRKIIREAREAVESSATWLSAQNERKTKKGSFWSTFLNKKKGGSQFLLSGEHYLTRSAG